MYSRTVKYFLVPILLLLSVSRSAAQADERDAHLKEAGTRAICARSAFAHGYRHGYEEGYHLGNMDINMARHARTRLSEFRDANLRYSPEFGPKKSFVTGFQDGLKSGYNDGFLGRKFRAVETLRSASNALNGNSMSADPVNTYFDQGISTGYSQGLHNARQDFYLTEPLNIGFGGCSGFKSSRQQDVTTQASFCDGYQRGYEMGQADALVLIPDARALASK